MGYSSIVLLAGIMGISGYVLLNPKDFPSTVLTAAGAALFVDVLGLLAGVWKISLNPELVGRLAPVTEAQLPSSVRTEAVPANEKAEPEIPERLT